MPADLTPAWAGMGIAVGVALTIYVQPLLAPVGSAKRTTCVLGGLLTGLTFGSIAWRFGHQFEVLPYSVLAALGVALGIVDVIVQRLPSVLIYTGLVLIGTLLAASAMIHAREPDFLRALAGMATVGGFYLVLALVSGTVKRVV